MSLCLMHKISRSNTFIIPYLPQKIYNYIIIIMYKLNKKGLDNMAMYGLDVSNWQTVGQGDGAKDFLIVKATEGTNFVDKTCDAHYQRARKQGKLLGVYHFARPDLNNAVAEADFFIKNVKGYIKEAILVLDFEVNTWNVSWAKTFLDRVKSQTGVAPLIYMSASVVNSYNWSSVAKDYGLWIAGYPYNVDLNKMPYGIGAWKAWAIWQYTSTPLDKNVSTLNRDQWKKYANPQSTITNQVNQVVQKVVAKVTRKSNDQIAAEVLAGKWGNGIDRQNRLKTAGYDYNAIQKIVNQKVQSQPVYYIIKSGDTLSSIAKKYNTTYQKLAQMNGIANPNVIWAGQRIRVK